MKSENESQSSLQIKKLHEEIANLKQELKKPHLTKNAEQDYDIKSHIIDKQTEIIELLMAIKP